MSDASVAPIASIASNTVIMAQEVGLKTTPEEVKQILNIKETQNKKFYQKLLVCTFYDFGVD